jgi:CRISPR-associated protein Csb2
MAGMAPNNNPFNRYRLAQLPQFVRKLQPTDELAVEVTGNTRLFYDAVPFYKNCMTAHRYDRNKRSNFVLPKRLDGKTAVHVRLHFEYEVPGPLTLGAGRHCGFGLFAAIDEK